MIAHCVALSFESCKTPSALEHLALAIEYDQKKAAIYLNMLQHSISKSKPCGHACWVQHCPVCDKVWWRELAENDLAVVYLDMGTHYGMYNKDKKALKEVTTLQCIYVIFRHF